MSRNIVHCCVEQAKRFIISGPDLDFFRLFLSTQLFIKYIYTSKLVDVLTVVVYSLFVVTHIV